MNDCRMIERLNLVLDFLDCQVTSGAADGSSIRYFSSLPIFRAKDLIP